MRLGQFARKLNIKPQEIAEFLKNELKVEISVHPNSKIEDEYIEAVKSFFSKEEKEQEEESIEDKKPAPEEVTKDENIQVNVKTSEVVEETIIDEVDDSDDSEKSSDEKELTEEDLNIVDGIIKAPEVEVSGVKVVGKIEIPEKKTEESSENEDSESDEVIESSKNEETSKPKRTKHNKKPKKRRGEKELSYEKKGKLELEKYEKEKQKRREEEKRKKRKHYEKVVQQKIKNKQSKKKKKSKKEVEEQQLTDQPKTLWGKFIRWLNT